MKTTIIKKAILPLTIASIFSVGTAHAELNLAIGTKAGTLGAGLEIFAPLSPKLNARIGVNQFGYSLEETIDGIAYTGDLNLQTISVNGDWHPFNGVFRMTLGAVINNNEIIGSATTANAIEFAIGDNDYSSQNIKANATINFENVAPYIGFGFDKVSKTRKGGLGFSAEFGVMFQGAPQVNFEVVDLNEGTPQAIQDALQEQLDGDIQREIDLIAKDLESFKVWPVASVGLTYQFQ